MQINLSEKTVTELVRFLPDAIAHALTSYQAFAFVDTPKSAKDFANHHTACKVAAAHIELLVKLARQVGTLKTGGDNGSQQIVLAALVQEAETELQSRRYAGLSSGEEENSCHEDE